MTVHARRLKVINFTLTDPTESSSASDAEKSFECQIRSWTLTPPQDDGETIYTYCEDGAYVEEPDDPTWTLDLTFLADWREGGISDFLHKHAGLEAAFTLDHHPNIDGEHVRWTGVVKLKAPPIGGDSRTTEEQTVTLTCVGEPTYERVEESSAGS